MVSAAETGAIADDDPGPRLKSEFSHTLLKPLYFLSVVLLCLPSMVFGGGTCTQYPEVTHSGWPAYSAKDCDCGKNLASKYTYKEPSGMALIAVCGFRKTELGDFQGGFFFRGHAVKDGAVEHQEYANGATLYFDGMKFVDETAAIRSFKMPSLTSTARCRTRRAKAEITRLLIVEGDSDEAGKWAMEYRVLKLGDIQSCTPE